MQMNVNYLKDNSTSALFGKPEMYEYSKYQNLEGFSLDENLMKEFLDIAQKLNLSQQSLEMLLDMAFNMSKLQNDAKQNDEKMKVENDIANWTNEFDNDLELPNKNSSALREYMSVADDAYNEFASAKLKEMFKTTGLIFHPELIKMFHKIGEIMQEDMLSYNGKPAIEELTPAQILYGNKE